MISVIIPFKNTEKYIEEALLSVLNQTYKNIEIILINDHSSDNSLNIIKKHKDKRIKIITLNETSGVANARNEGIKIAKGDYISFIDSDDIWEKTKLEKQIKFINDRPFVFSSYYYMKNNKTKPIIVPKKMSYNDYIKNTIILTSTVMLNMKILNKQDIYMPDIYMGEDAALWLRLLKMSDAYAIEEPLAYYRARKDSLSSNKFKAVKRTWSLLKKENIFLPKRIYCFLSYIIYAVLKRI